MSEPTVPQDHGNGEPQHLEGELPDAPLAQEAPATNGTADSMDVEMKEEPVESNLAPANVPPAQNTTTTTSVDTSTNTTTTATSTPSAQSQTQPPPPPQQQATAPSSSTAAPTAASTTPPPPAPTASTSNQPAASTTSASTPTSTAPAMAPRDQRADSATRTGSPRPGQQQAQQQPHLPREALPHGSPTRVYLNSHITPYLLEGMKQVAVIEPEKPLQWLSNFLAEKSKEVEGTGAGNGSSLG